MTRHTSAVPNVLMAGVAPLTAGCTAGSSSRPSSTVLMTSHHRLYAFAALLLGTMAAATCREASFGPGDTLTEGTWGGDDTGLIVNDTVAHVHFGCTYGNFPAPVELDEEGRFSVSGEYVLQAYPIVVGPPMPAELVGVVEGIDVTMTVAVNDTVQDRLVVFGPKTVRLGREPTMQMCPICESPD